MAKFRPEWRHLKPTLLYHANNEFRKYRTTRSKFENLSRSAALTQFVKYISVYTSTSRDALISSFWMNIDNNPTPFQMAENGIISINSQ